MTAIHATVAALWRHPVKGFTPEAVSEALLTAGDFFPFDRLFALEVGKSGYDPHNPQVIPKLRFAVLARFPAVARLRSRYDEFNDELELTGSDNTRRFAMREPAGRHALARHVETVLSAHEDYDPIAAPLNLLDVPGPDKGAPFRFTDSGKGFVSFLNLNSLRDLGQRAGRDLDPLRMRANVWLEGLTAFEDHAWVGRHLRIGEEGPSAISTCARRSGKTMATAIAASTPASSRMGRSGRAIPSRSFDLDLPGRAFIAGTTFIPLYEAIRCRRLFFSATAKANGTWKTVLPAGSMSI